MNQVSFKPPLNSIMSSKDGEKRKAPSDAATAPAAKRQTITASIVQSNRSLLLQSQPEILRNVYSFLKLKEALVLRQVHRQLNNASNDIFQYSVIMSYDAMKRQGFLDGYICEYMNKQEKALCNLPDNQSLQAVLQNETLPSNLAKWFIYNMATNSTADNGQAVSILLQDERCIVGISFLDECLKGDFTAMAAVAQQDDRVKKNIEMCHTCSSNIGCYYCANRSECSIYDNIKYPKFCRECVLEDDRFCEHCNDYLCPTCHEEGDSCCESCDGIECLECEGEYLIQCQLCDRFKCESCINKEGEVWSMNERRYSICPPCKQVMQQDIDAR